jgi:predicted enzyme related to lactoylglutathione lyase
MQIQGVGQIAITVPDMEAAKKFYGDVLGLPHLFDAGPRLSFFQAGEVRLMLSLPDGEATVGTGTVIYYRVGNCGAAHVEALARGADDAGTPHMIAKMADHELWMGFLRDPAGNLVGLMEERR